MPSFSYIFNALCHGIVQALIHTDQLRVTENRGEQVVEVVGYTPGQPSYRLELLRLFELLLQPYLLGNIDGRGQDTRHSAFRVTNNNILPSAGNNGPILAQVLIDVGSYLITPLHVRVQELLHFFPKLSRNDQFKLTLTHSLFSAPAEDPFRRPVPLQNVVPGIKADDGRGHSVHHKPVPGLAPLLGLLGPLSLGDIYSHAHQADNPAVIHRPVDHKIDPPGLSAGCNHPELKCIPLIPDLQLLIKGLTNPLPVFSINKFQEALSDQLFCLIAEKPGSRLVCKADHALCICVKKQGPGSLDNSAQSPFYYNLIFPVQQ